MLVQCYNKLGAKALRIMTFSITTLGVMTLSITMLYIVLSVVMLIVASFLGYAECHSMQTLYAERH
jgi:hypothetical protein